MLNGTLWTVYEYNYTTLGKYSNVLAVAALIRLVSISSIPLPYGGKSPSGCLIRISLFTVKYTYTRLPGAESQPMIVFIAFL